MLKYSVLGLGLLISVSAFASMPSLGNVDTLKLTITNNSKYPLYYAGQFNHAPATYDFSINKNIIPAGGSAIIQAKALVSENQTDGLSGTAKFTVNKQAMSFVIGDTAIGWDRTPMFGFGDDNSTLSSHLTYIHAKSMPKSYDLSGEIVNITINNR